MMTATPPSIPRSLLAAAFALAAVGAPDVAHATDCGFHPSSGKSCCWENHHENLGTPQAGDVWQAPALATTDGGVTADLFVQGWDNAVWTRTRTSIGWTDWHSLGGIVTSRPTAVAAGSSLYVFARGTDHSVWYRARTAAGWSGWSSLGGAVRGGVAAAAWPSGEIELSAVGSDGQLWSNSVTGTAATGWVSRGGGLFGEPAAVAHAATPDGGHKVEHWVIANDGALWRLVHTRDRVRIGWSDVDRDFWGSWEPRLSGVVGAPGLATNPSGIDATSYASYVHDGAGSVWTRVSDHEKDGDWRTQPAIRTYSDLSIARDAKDTEPFVAYVNGDDRNVLVYSSQLICSTCGDGRCYGTESCSSCAADCGACEPTCDDGTCNGSESCSSCAADCGSCPPPPPSSCQDYAFCLKTTTDKAAGGSALTGFGCTLPEARSNAFKKAAGGILHDGACPPPACDGEMPWVVEWCCTTTGTSYFGAACNESAADAAAKLDESCAESAWEKGVCD